MNTRNVHDRLNGIEAFVQAAEAGSFALAAERLRLTRSAVGKSIARLEARLGVRLFHRTTRQQSLTDDGQAYYDRCVRAGRAAGGRGGAGRGRREPQGRLRVTAPLVFGRHCVAPVLRELAGRYPQLEVDISFSDRVVDLIDEAMTWASASATCRTVPASRPAAWACRPWASARRPPISPRTAVRHGAGDAGARRHHLCARRPGQGLDDAGRGWPRDTVAPAAQPAPGRPAGHRRRGHRRRRPGLAALLDAGALCRHGSWKC